MVGFLIDAASFQGNVDWATVDSTMIGGFEKVTQGSPKTASRGYVNPNWALAKQGLRARSAATGFIPGAYLFLEAGDGAGQADFFAQFAGDLTGFALIVDVEPTATSRPTLVDAHACVSRLRTHYPNHPIGGYPPEWYLGQSDETFFDWTWASRYVPGGSRSPQTLYSEVTPDYWHAYGGVQPLLLQFTNQAIVPGVAGHVDCSAFRGTADELRSLIVTGKKPAGKPTTTKEEQIGMMLNNGANALTVVAFTGGSRTWIAFGNDSTLEEKNPPVLRIACHSHSKGWSQTERHAIPASGKSTLHFREQDVNMLSVRRVGGNDGDDVVVGYNLG